MDDPRHGKRPCFATSNMCMTFIKDRLIVYLVKLLVCFVFASCLYLCYFVIDGISRFSSTCFSLSLKLNSSVL